MGPHPACQACPPAAGPAAAAAGAESGLRPALRVRNTFLDVRRSASLERFLDRACASRRRRPPRGARACARRSPPAWRTTRCPPT
ncbi:unnamed protein product [Prorocentrum cordatum]|uniref:Uncharacterized protein n=1 Tax=Prorocentrum cordatum TaxID=2364126 RepID=A0ABN9QS32_9DINO|nr:unnamed protein product [Polarella glacialis]